MTAEDARDAALREDIRALGVLLGQSLAHHGGPGLLEAVERIRAAVRDDPAEASRIIDDLGLDEATMIARAFSIYFDLANVAEQVQRARDVLPFQGAARTPADHRGGDHRGGGYRTRPGQLVIAPTPARHGLGRLP